METDTSNTERSKKLLSSIYKPMTMSSFVEALKITADMAIDGPLTYDDDGEARPILVSLLGVGTLNPGEEEDENCTTAEMIPNSGISKAEFIKGRLEATGAQGAVATWKDGDHRVLYFMTPYGSLDGLILNPGEESWQYCAPEEIAKITGDSSILDIRWDPSKKNGELWSTDRPLSVRLPEDQEDLERLWARIVMKDFIKIDHGYKAEDIACWLVYGYDPSTGEPVVRKFPMLRSARLHVLFERAIDDQALAVIVRGFGVNRIAKSERDGTPTDTKLKECDTDVINWSCVSHDGEGSMWMCQLGPQGAKEMFPYGGPMLVSNAIPAVFEIGEEQPTWVCADHDIKGNA